MQLADPDGRCSRNAFNSFADFGYCLKEDIGYPIGNAGIWFANEGHYLKENTKQELGLAPFTEIMDAYSYYKPQQRQPELQQYDDFKAKWNRWLQGPVPQRTLDGRLVLIPETDQQRAARAHDRQLEGVLKGSNASAHLALKGVSVAFDIDMALSGIGILRSIGTHAFALRSADAALDRILAEEAEGVSAKRIGSRARADFVDAIAAGRRGGRLYGQERLARLQKYLDRRGVDLLVGDEYVGGTQAGGFTVFEDGARPQLTLRSNPTQYEVWHELSHYLQWKRVGPDVYWNLPRLLSFNAPEQFVFDLLENSPRRWSLLNEEEQQHAIGYIERVGGFR